MRHSFSFQFIAVAVLLLDALVCQGEDAHDDLDTKRKIFTAWTQRQEALKSFQCKGTLVRRDAVAHMEPTQQQTVRANYPDVGEFLETTHHFAVKMDGERFDFRMDTVDAEKSAGLNGYRGSFDGKVSQLYSGTLGDGVGSGIITDKKHAYGPNHVYLKPIVVFLRPLHATMGNIDETYRCLPQREAVGDVSAIVLEQTGKHPSLWKYWIDPGHDYLVRRVALLMEEATLIIDIEYKADPDYGLIPRSWKTVDKRNDGTLSFETQCELRTVELNKPIDDREFKIVFPKGTHVEDRVTNRKYIQ